MKCWGCKLEEQEIALQNIDMLYNAQEKVIKLFDDYSTIASETKYKTIHREEHPKKCFEDCQ